MTKASWRIGGSEEEENRKGRGQEKEKGGETLEVERRVFVPPPSCSIISEASEVVCTQHSSLFNLPDVNEVVCISHTILFGLPDIDE